MGCQYGPTRAENGRPSYVAWFVSAVGCALVAVILATLSPDCATGTVRDSRGFCVTSTTMKGK